MAIAVKTTLRLLFLDIDGVLNRDSTLNVIGGDDPDHKNLKSVEPAIFDKFTKWKLDKDVEIVLSSSWRVDQITRDHLNDLGLFFYGTTPCWSGYSATHRGLEIGKYLQDHHDKYPYIRITNVAILDDYPHLFPVGKWLIQTSPRHGLQDKHLRMLDKYLGYDTGP